MPAYTVAVHCNALHTFSKSATAAIELVAGHGVWGNAHYGTTVQHRSRVAKDPTQSNLRQVHLLQAELLDALQANGHPVVPGQLGENITTQGLAVLTLSAGTRLQVGAQAILRVTGLRNPCVQIENFQAGLLAAVLGRADNGALVRKAGVMCVVEQSGTVRAGDAITVRGQPEHHVPLQPV